MRKRPTIDVFLQLAVPKKNTRTPDGSSAIALGRACLLSVEVVRPTARYALSAGLCYQGQIDEARLGTCRLGTRNSLIFGSSPGALV